MPSDIDKNIVIATLLVSNNYPLKKTELTNLTDVLRFDAETFFKS